MVHRRRQPGRPGRLHHWLVLVLTLAAAAPAAAAVEHYVGEARARDGGRLLYSESHWIKPLEGGGQHRLVLYRCPDGKAFARKMVNVGSDAQAPDFELDDGRTGYREGVRGDGTRRTVYYRAAHDEGERSAPLSVGADTVIDAGFDAFVRQHWDALLARHAIHIDMLVPSRLRTVNFRVVDHGREPVDGREVQRFRVRLDAWYGFALPHIDVGYDAATRRLLDYRGLSNIRDIDGRNLNVRIDFPPHLHQDHADPASMRAAEAAPLDGRCPL